MLIEIHAIQNHSPANLNRDDLGAPKTCYFGGVLRSRLSSQCLKRSIRTSGEFKLLLGGVRTRRLAQLVAIDDGGRQQLLAGYCKEPPKFDEGTFQKAMEVFKICGIAPKDKKGGDDDDDKSAGLVYTTRSAINQMSNLLKKGGKSKDLATEFAKFIAHQTDAPDMALFGRMLEPKKAKKDGKGKAGDGDQTKDEGDENAKGKGVWRDLDPTVEAALQVAHAISTHEARPEVDYYVAADDVPGQDAGAGFVDEAMFASACFYKYFSIDWKTLVENLEGYGEDHEKLAAHTVGAFIRGAALVNPTGKQNSFAAHNPPDGMLVEIRSAPLSYANAFARPVAVAANIKEDGRDMISQSIAQLGQYVYDIDAGYGRPTVRFWFSPNLRYSLVGYDRVKQDGKEKLVEIVLAGENFKSLDELIPAVIKEIGHDWGEVKKIVVNPEVPDERKHVATSA
jgi:CRISPR system Cascade subunit CasC